MKGFHGATKMTDIWDTLWLNVLGLPETPLEECVLWIKEVKAEGDMLKEKAEKWDLVQDYIIVELKTDPPSFFGKSETLDEFVKMKQKLEAVKTWYHESVRDYARVRLRPILNDLWEILEGEG